MWSLKAAYRTGAQTQNTQQLHKDDRRSEQGHPSTEPAVNLEGRGRAESVRGFPLNMEWGLRSLWRVYTQHLARPPHFHETLCRGLNPTGPARFPGTCSKNQQGPDCWVQWKHVVLTELSCWAHFPISGGYVWGYVSTAVPEWWDVGEGRQVC